MHKIVNLRTKTRNSMWNFCHPFHRLIFEIVHILILLDQIIVLCCLCVCVCLCVMCSVEKKSCFHLVLQYQRQLYLSFFYRNGISLWMEYLWNCSLRGIDSKNVFIFFQCSRETIFIYHSYQFHLFAINELKMNVVCFLSLRKSKYDGTIVAH